jgi:hypothetical protein
MCADRDVLTFRFLLYIFVLCGWMDHPRQADCQVFFYRGRERETKEGEKRDPIVVHLSVLEMRGEKRRGERTKGD